MSKIVSSLYGRVLFSRIMCSFYTCLHCGLLGLDLRFDAEYFCRYVEVSIET